MPVDHCDDLRKFERHVSRPDAISPAGHRRRARRSDAARYVDLGLGAVHAGAGHGATLLVRQPMSRFRPHAHLLRRQHPCYPAEPLHRKLHIGGGLAHSMSRTLRRRSLRRRFAALQSVWPVIWRRPCRRGLRSDLHLPWQTIDLRRRRRPNGRAMSAAQCRLQIRLLVRSRTALPETRRSVGGAKGGRAKCSVAGPV